MPPKRKASINWLEIGKKGAPEFGLIDLRAVKKNRWGKRDGSSQTNTNGRSTKSNAIIMQRNPFEGVDLSTIPIQVDKKAMWEKMLPYMSCAIRGSQVRIYPNDNVLIKARNDQAGPEDAIVEGWVAKVLEIRGVTFTNSRRKEATYVYLRVYWLYRPEDLPWAYGSSDPGRRPYHGKNELIASNHMSIVSVQTVNDIVDVKYWQELPSQGEELDPDQLFWRQALDISKTGNLLSNLPRHCVCDTPWNPDDLLINCESCGKWLHGSCIKKAAKLEFRKAEVAQRRKTGSLPKIKGRETGSVFTPKFEQNHIGKIRLTITEKSKTKEPESWIVPINCLLCNASIDDDRDRDDETTASDSENPSFFEAPSRNRTVPSLRALSSGVSTSLVDSNPASESPVPGSRSASTRSRTPTPGPSNPVNRRPHTPASRIDDDEDRPASPWAPESEVRRTYNMRKSLLIRNSAG